MSPASPRPAGSTAAAALASLLAIGLLLVPGLPPGAARGESTPDHLVISEVVTGGASASDELIELYNPTATALPLEGLELVYVTASGATISRRAAWELGAPSLEPGRHLLVANELGVYAAIADALYASGMAATGGSVALRIQGASSAVDAVGWGTAASTWLEGQVAGAPPSGSSLERLPGGDAGSTQDSDDNATDFVVRAVPEPQNLGSSPVPDPSATPESTVVPSVPPASPSASAAPTGSTSPDPSVHVVSIATARALPDGTEATIEGVALTSSTFGDGGGYVADMSGGIAAIVTGATFERGELLRLSGAVDDRFAQRTLRVEAAGIARLGTAPEPSPPIPAATGVVAETLEGVLARVAGTIVGPASTLTTGVAFDLDDGSGAVRLVVGTSTGIDVAGWDDGTAVDMVGVVGQRDATGSGVSGYRVQPRDTVDIISVGAPNPEASGDATPAPSASTEPGSGVISIAAARMLPKNARALVRGTVTLEPGIVDATTAVIQDGSGAIVLRVGDDTRSLRRGDLVEVHGVRSTKSGMETLRASSRPERVGGRPDPAPRELRTGEAGEAVEAQLVRVRGAVLPGVRRAPTGSVSFEVDDGSGALRIYVAGPLQFDSRALSPGAWVDITGVLGQETTGAQPLRGYRMWPRDVSEIRVVATATGSPSGGGAGDSGGPSSQVSAGLNEVTAEAVAGMRVGATLVVGPWPELGLGGLLWDGSRLAGIHPDGAAAVETVLGGRGAPVAVELTAPRAMGEDAALDLPLIHLDEGQEAIVAGNGRVTPPSTRMPPGGGAPRWMAVVGRLEGTAGTPRLAVPGDRIELEIRCDDTSASGHGIVAVVGIALADMSRIVVPCGGIRPAPTLERPAAAAGVSGAADLRAGPGESPSIARGSPIAPAALLGMAALALLGGAILARRLGTAGPDPDDETAATSVDGELEPSAPVLTLVPMPRERAP